MKRALILVVPFALTLVACSGDDDDTAATTTDVTTTDAASPDTAGTEESGPDVSDPDESSSDFTIPDFTIPDFSIPDLSDISIPDLSNISIPDVSIPDNLEELLGEMFPRLDDEQVSCLVDVADDLGGSITDPSSLLDFLDECNIDVSELAPGG